MHTSSPKPCQLESTKPSGNLPLYNHCVHKHMDTWPTWSHTDSETLSGYWDINGVKAHCLLDSGCEGVMISPDLMHAMGIVPINLEQLRYDRPPTCMCGQQVHHQLVWCQKHHNVWRERERSIKVLEVMNAYGAPPMAGNYNACVAADSYLYG